MGPDPLSIVVRSNRVQNSQEMEELVLHELIHIYDVRKLQLNLKDCESLAYSEVRAAREAECHRRNDKFALCYHLHAREYLIIHSLVAHGASKLSASEAVRLRPRPNLVETDPPIRS